MKVHDSALKHGVLAEDSVQAADWPVWAEPLDEADWPHLELRLGFGTQARLLETVVLIFESGGEMVIHAMAARKQYLEPTALSRDFISPQGDPVVARSAGRSAAGLVLADLVGLRRTRGVHLASAEGVVHVLDQLWIRL
ncbi:hypothetical protein [Nocardioides terrisoli]|uniref:hypothetical protein n=1 Tax=Nocardioides terrisoli TaxID=3388267 RepID=UPI00287BB818|nr:hypothetical protein [Nocardioides marmorisolisilvae]